METGGRGIFKFRRTDAKGTLMSNTPSVKSSDFSLTSVPAFWPMANPLYGVLDKSRFGPRGARRATTCTFRLVEVQTG